MKKDNIVLIGMPGAGKSAVGRELSKKLHMAHVDIDTVMEEAEGMKLQEVINTKGVDYATVLEAKTLENLKTKGYVISPGGSCIYHEKGMENLAKLGHIVYLKVSWPVLEKRCKNVNGRGILFKPGETLKDIYDRRIPVYEKYAEITVDTSDYELMDTVNEVYKIVTEI